MRLLKGCIGENCTCVPCANSHTSYPVEPLYCAKPVKFLSVSKTADGAPVGVDV
jgi:hypothetical protein